MLCPNCGKEVGEQVGLCLDCLDMAQTPVSRRKSLDKGKGEASSPSASSDLKDDARARQAGASLQSHRVGRCNPCTPGNRVCAFLTDVGIVGAIISCVVVVILNYFNTTPYQLIEDAKFGTRSALDLLLLICAWKFGIWYSYWLLMELVLRGSTFGKVIFGLSVVTSSFEHLSIAKIFIRNFLKQLPVVFILFAAGFIIIKNNITINFNIYYPELSLVAEKFLLVSLVGAAIGLFGYTIALFTGYCQTLHDKLVNCFVVYVPEAGQEWKLARYLSLTIIYCAIVALVLFCFKDVAIEFAKRK